MLLVTQGAADATDFERVGEAGMDMIVTVDRMDLGFASQTTECARKYDPVMVFMERAAPEFFGAGMRFSKAFSIQQGLPIQGSMLRE